MDMYMQCWKDDGVVVIPSRVTMAPHVCKERCSRTSGHINTSTLPKASQCQDVVQFRGTTLQPFHHPSLIMSKTFTKTLLISPLILYFQSKKNE